MLACWNHRTYEESIYEMSVSNAITRCAQRTPTHIRTCMSSGEQHD